MKKWSPRRMHGMLKKWFDKIPEAVLCQRDKDFGITFTPMMITNVDVERGILQGWLPKSQSSYLQYSKNYFKTVTIVSHRSTKSSPTKNRGFFLILSVIDWEEDIIPEEVDVSRLWPKEKEFVRVRFTPLRGSFWSGTKFGSFRWKKLPRGIPKGFNKPRYLPPLGNARRITQDELCILNQCQFLFIAVLTRYGTLHVTPVDFVVVKNRVVLATSLFSAKLRHFIKTWTAAAYTYPTKDDTVHGDFSKALVMRGRSFVYGWNPFLALAYGFIFSPYLVLVTSWMRRKYPNTIKNFPKNTNFRWRFIPIVGRTFLEINWERE